MKLKTYFFALLTFGIIPFLSSAPQASAGVPAQTGSLQAAITVKQSGSIPLYQQSFQVAMGKAEKKKKTRRNARSRTKARSKEMEKYRQKQLKLIRKKHRR